MSTADDGSPIPAVDGVAAAAAAAAGAVGGHQESKLHQVVERSHRTVAGIDHSRFGLHPVLPVERRADDLLSTMTSQASRYSQLQQLRNSAAVLLRFQRLLHIHQLPHCCSRRLLIGVCRLTTSLDSVCSNTISQR